jgi:hypothetical protein
MMPPSQQTLRDSSVLTPYRIALVVALAAACSSGSANAAAGDAKAAASGIAKATPSGNAKTGPTCKDLAFSVNDYGKEGPTRDAQALLDKHIEQWAKDEGIKKYKVGKKNVNCELYLDVGLFDEYTCKATANVCWSK